jgi:hypothetical protein
LADELKKLAFSFSRRVIPTGGPFDSEAWNDSFEEMAADLAALSKEWNVKLVKVTSTLPIGS